MIKGGKGGANTQTGLHFEAKTDIRQIFEAIPGYNLKPTSDNAGYEVWFHEKLLAHCFKNRSFTAFWRDTVLTGKCIYPNV